MSVFSTWARSLAKKADYWSVSHAPFNTDGAQPETHSTEKQLLMLENILSKPLTYEDLVSTISLLFSCTEINPAGIQRSR